MAATTPAITAIEAAGVPHRVVRTERAGSAEESAALQGIPLGALLRTIVVRRGDDDYLFVLVPAGRRFDWPKLRAHLGVRRLTLPDADEARDGHRLRALHDHAVRLEPGLAGDPRRLGDAGSSRCRSAAARSGSTCTSRRPTWSARSGPRSSTSRRGRGARSRRLARPHGARETRSATELEDSIRAG